MLEGKNCEDAQPWVQFLKVDKCLNALYREVRLHNQSQFLTVNFIGERKGDILLKYVFALHSLTSDEEERDSQACYVRDPAQPVAYCLSQ